MKVLCMGSSATNGLRNDITYYPELLNSYQDIVAINAGKIGLSFETSIEYAKELLPLVKPDLVTIMLGLNELKEYCPYQLTFSHAIILVNLIRSYGVIPIIGTLPYMCDDAHEKFRHCKPYIEEYNALLYEFANNNNVEIVDNYYNTMNDDLFVEDKYHPNSEGHKVIAKNFIQGIDKIRFKQQ